MAYEHISYHTEQAASLKEELDADQGSWFQPKGQPRDGTAPGDFDYGQMKFLNRNLNYFYIENMISHALRGDYEYNPGFPKALAFCNYLREYLDEPGPFGRMCMWKLVGKAYLSPHYDRWAYHHNISRYILCVSDHASSEATIRIAGKEIEVKQGLLFSFAPSVEEHEFINHTDRDWNFLGFDYWVPDKLKSMSELHNVSLTTDVPYQPGFGGFNRRTKYMSKE
jgi:hypothetical protein